MSLRSLCYWLAIALVGVPAWSEHVKLPAEIAVAGGEGAESPLVGEIVWEPLEPAAGDALVTPIEGVGRYELRVRMGVAGSIPGLTAGAYRVVARAAGLAPARRSLVQVTEGRETELREPLRLEPLLVQEVHVHPRQSPMGRPWTISLRAADARRHRAKCTTGSDGSCSLADLPSGVYKLRVEDLPGSIWWDRVVEVGSYDLPIRVDLPVVGLEGRITMGGEPARARMFFRKEALGSAVEIFSDHGGAFHGHLPGDGDWRVTAAFEPRGAETDLGTQWVAATEDGSSAWLELEVPATDLGGEVFDADGAPVLGAWVYLHQTGEGERRRSSVQTDDRGRFHFWGLAEGSYVARVIGPQSAETTEELEVREGRSRRLRVRLPGSTRLRGQVVTLDGEPVAGAEVHLMPNVALSEMPGVERVITGPDGGFEAAMPAAAREVTVTILPPGRSARITRLAIPDEGDLSLVVRPWGGTLRLRHPGQRLVVGAKLQHGDAWAWLGTLASWPALHGMPGGLGGEAMTLPMMEPGVYRFCTAAGDPCTQGTLAPGGDLELTLPVAE